MATSWSLNNVKVYNTLNGNSDVIYLVNYNVIASDDNGNVFTLSKEESIDTSNITNFVSFANLTESIVMGWVKTELGTDAVSDINQEAEDALSDFLNTSVKTL